ncbi:MAG: ABC transporter ATP-binding protein [Candidatus Omnitrophica bacterium]|nr:ABC transporter ATP-binding protein [Candidatus Omnitrophota bacterium]
MNALELNNVGEKYRVKFIKEGEVFWDEIWAVEGVTLGVDKGETLGVIGQNGSGKTTLLKLIAGMLIPDTGKVRVSGKISTIMELGAGFNPEFTGRENITVNARIYGLEDSALKEAILKIVEFADLGKFIDAPIKYYSQGMYMRLAFALAIFVNPDILLIDDILAVGDQEAQQKCIKKIFELKNSGKTIIVVSHDMTMINRLCDRVILLEKGGIVQDGTPTNVIPYYLATIGDKKGVATLENEYLCAVFNNGRIAVNYRGILVTKETGGCVYYCRDNLNVWSPSYNLDWHIRESSANEILAESLNAQGGVLQSWRIRIEKDQVKWHVEIKDSSVRDSYINLFLSSQYKEWTGLSKEGFFPDFAHKTNWQDVALIQGAEATLGITAQQKDYPTLLIATDSSEGQIKLFNSGYEQEARIVQINANKASVSLAIKFYSQQDQFDEYMRQARQELAALREKELKLYIAAHTINSGPLRLFADAEAKALRVFYKDKELTRANGLHSSFLFNKAWYNTSACEWQAVKEKNALILRFHWLSPKFNQTWKMYFEENSLICQSESEVEPESRPQELKFGICACSDYKTFFCGAQVQDFPGEFSYWQEMSIENQNATRLGLDKQPGLPAVAFENNNRFPCIIQNSDSHSRFRVVQLALPEKLLAKKTFSFSARLDFLEDESSLKDYIQQSRQELLFKQEQERLSRLAGRTIESGPLRLFADVETKALRIFYKDKELTRANGLHSSFRISQEKAFFTAKDAEWSVQKMSQGELVVRLRYPSLTQAWKCVLKDDNALEFIIELQVDKPVSLADHQVRIELQDDYKRWETAEEDGDLSGAQYINNISPVRLKNSKAAKIIFRPEGKKGNPPLLFETKFPADKQILGIYKYRYPDTDSVFLNFSLIIPKNEENVDPGKYTYFMGRIVVNSSVKIEDGLVSAGSVELKSGDLRFLFNQGGSRIFSGGKELTTGLGVYTSVRSSGIWHDSYQAVWKIASKTDAKLTVSGSWPYVPISQHWQVELLDKDSIVLTIDMEVHEQVYLEIEQTSLMLFMGYKHWQAAALSQGEFLDEHTRDYDILPFRFWYGKMDSRGLKAGGAGLPAVWFKPVIKNELFRMIAENTDYIYQGRLLQYQKSNAGALTPGRYNYFAGVIKIEP